MSYTEFVISHCSLTLCNIFYKQNALSQLCYKDTIFLKNKIIKDMNKMLTDRKRQNKVVPVSIS